MAAVPLSETTLINDANLEGYWTFDTDGTDSSTNGNNLTASAGAAITSSGGGKFTEAAYFDLGSGVDNYYNTSTTGLDITGPQTWGCWIAPDSDATINRRFMDGDGGNIRFLRTRGTKSLQFVIQGLTPNVLVTSDTNVFATDGTWTFVVGRYDTSATGEELSIWINGVRNQAVEATGTASGTMSGMYIGSQENGSNGFDGKVDDAWIFSRALTDAEILGLWEGTLTPGGDGGPTPTGCMTLISKLWGGAIG